MTANAGSLIITLLKTSAETVEAERKAMLDAQAATVITRAGQKPATNNETPITPKSTQ